MMSVYQDDNKNIYILIEQDICTVFWKYAQIYDGI